MSYSIIGFGEIGQTLAKAFARKDIAVSVATTRDPESFASAAASIGPGIKATTLAEAVKADVIFLAVRFQSHADVAKAVPDWQGKIIVDVTNAYGVSSEELGEQPSAKVVEAAFAGGRLVKGFNHLVAAVLDQDPAVHGGRRVVFLTMPQLRSVRSRRTWASHRSCSARCRKAGCSCRRTTTSGAA